MSYTFWIIKRLVFIQQIDLIFIVSHQLKDLMIFCIDHIIFKVLLFLHISYPLIKEMKIWNLKIKELKTIKIITFLNIEITT